MPAAAIHSGRPFPFRHLQTAIWGSAIGNGFRESRCRRGRSARSVPQPSLEGFVCEKASAVSAAIPNRKVVVGGNISLHQFAKEFCDDSGIKIALLPSAKTMARCRSCSDHRRACCIAFQKASPIRSTDLLPHPAVVMAIRAGSKRPDLPDGSTDHRYSDPGQFQ